MGKLERKPGGPDNWVEALPKQLQVAFEKSVIYRAAVHMNEKGMPVGIAIASAINWAKHICRTGDVKQWKGPQQVRPDNRAEACAAVAVWNTMKATSKAKRATNMTRDPIAEIDLASGYLARIDGDKPHVSKGEVRAFLDLSEIR